MTEPMEAGSVSCAEERQVKDWRDQTCGTCEFSVGPAVLLCLRFPPTPVKWATGEAADLFPNAPRDRPACAEWRERMEKP